MKIKEIYLFYSFVFLNFINRICFLTLRIVPQIDVPEAGYYTVSYSLARGDWSGDLTIALLLDDVQDMSVHSSSYDTLCDDYSSMLASFKMFYISKLLF